MTTTEWVGVCLIVLVLGGVVGFFAGNQWAIRSISRWLARAEIAMREASKTGNTIAVIELPGFISARRTFRLMYRPRGD